MIESEHISRRRFHQLAGAAVATAATGVLWDANPLAAAETTPAGQHPMVSPNTTSGVSNKRRALSKIKDVRGLYALDLNFRNAGGSSMSDDFPGLTPEKLLAWHKAIHSDSLAWVQAKLQCGYTIFPSKVAPRMKHLAPDFFQRWCELAKNDGMYVLGYSCGGSDFLACQQHPEWFKEYGAAYACLNAPFWDREFQVVQEFLKIFPCDGFFYDMVRFSGNCRCDSCRTAYQKFYGEKMPTKYDVRQFRFDTFKRWAQRATKAAREIVPTIEIACNHQWYRIYGDGLPYELLELFDWYYCEFDTAEWVAEILRAWGGDKPTLSGGGTFDARLVAHLVGRRLTPHGYSSAYLDYRTGECLLPASDVVLMQVERALGETKKHEPYVKDASAVLHATVLFSSAANASLGDAKYADIVTASIRQATRMNLTCCNVEIAERLTADKLSKYEVVFAPEVGSLDARVVSLLHRWVHDGGVLLAGGPAAIPDGQGKPRPTCADAELLGMKKIGRPLDKPGTLTAFQSGAGVKEMEMAINLENTTICVPKTAEPVGYGQVGADQKVPLIWRNRLGDGVVFYLAGRIGKGVEKAEKPLCGCLRALLAPHIRKTPFRTSMEHPAEVWLNEQPHEKRLVMHVVAFEKPLLGQQVSVRADLIAEDAIEIVYPASKKTVIQGERSGGYVHFPLPEMHEHVILVLKKAEKG